MRNREHRIAALAAALAISGDMNADQAATEALAICAESLDDVQGIAAKSGVELVVEEFEARAKIGDGEFVVWEVEQRPDFDRCGVCSDATIWQNRLQLTAAETREHIENLATCIRYIEWNAKRAGA